MPNDKPNKWTFEKVGAQERLIELKVNFFLFHRIPLCDYAILYSTSNY